MQPATVGIVKKGTNIGIALILRQISVKSVAFMTARLQMLITLNVPLVNIMRIGAGYES